MEELKKELEPNQLTLPPMISNKIPIFLPKETKRIAFFKYDSKSVREVKTEDLEAILTKLAKKNIEEKENRKTMIEADLKSFAQYHAKHQFEAYRTDIKTKTIQFNAYNDKDNLLLEKSFVRGGLVFDMDPKDFFEQIEISYPRHRKKRSDNKNDYLPLELIKMRGIHLKKETQN
jgi:predicted HTH transcriptional regulator